jgi:hypothetical protein
LLIIIHALVVLIYVGAFQPNVYLSNEQMVSKLNVTYLALIRLGFEKVDVEEALSHTYTGESEDALDWVGSCLTASFLMLFIKQTHVV